ncbi:MAG: hypothetical protein ABSG95_13610 [Solirubrobacteraceae bacterium]|jgi:hypothetical protein
MSAQKALERTVDLVRTDVFPKASAAEVVAALTGTRVRLRADERELSSVEGQTVVATTAIVAAQSGVELVLDLADVPLLPDQPPLRGAGFDDAVLELTSDLITPANRDDGGDVDLTINFGATPSAGRPALRLAPVETGFELTPHDRPRSRSWSESEAFAAMFGGVAAGAETFRTAMRTLARNGHRPILAKAAREPLPMQLAVPRTTRTGDLGAIDVISAGAMTQGMLFALLRVPDISAQVRVFDDDLLDWPNLNRYPLARQALLEHPKAMLLERYSTSAIEISGIQARFDEHLAGLVKLQSLVAIGVDHIPSRWQAQAAAPGAVVVGATSHFEVVVSSHPAGEPCAGCFYQDDGDDDRAIPTASFVSTFAGILQACRLLSQPSERPRAHLIRAAPLNLAGARPMVELGVARRTNCPAKCRERVLGGTQDQT